MSRKTVDELSYLLEQKLAESGLSLEDGEQLGLELHTGDEAFNKLRLKYAAGGVKIPYYDIDGNETDFWRFRYLEQVLNGFAALSNKKPIRYLQAHGSLNQLYFPPLIDWKKVKGDTAKPIIFTEGELKSACAAKLGLTTIGLGGVWCFRSSANHLHILPEFNEIDWEKRVVYICYDSDASSNNLVMSAENALAKELLNLGAFPRIIRLPSLAPPSKTGLDDFLVSEGVRPFRELMEEAPEWLNAKELFELNEEVLYVRDPGIILKLDNLQKMSHRAFIDHAFSDRKFFEEVPVARGGTRMVEKSAPAEWIKWPCRAEVERITYKPGQDRITAENELNIWSGWGCLPAEGDITPWKQLLDYVFEDADPDHRVWFEQWLAYPLQHPGEKLFSAAVIWGTQHGTGKSLIGHTMAKIYGRNAIEIGDQGLHDSFNGWAENRQFVMGEEITSGDKRQNGDRMKKMITQREMRINQKFLPQYTVPDCINYYFTSNHPDSFFLEDTDRRYFVHALNRPPLPQSFYRKYAEWLEGSGPHALFHYLLNLDVSDFDPQGPAPMTDAKVDMINNGRSDVGLWVATLREYPDAVLRQGNDVLNFCLMTSQELHSLYDFRSPNKVTINGMSRELSRANFPRVNGGQPIDTPQGPQRLWMVRPIQGHEKMDATMLAELYKVERGKKCQTTSKF